MGLTIGILLWTVSSMASSSIVLAPATMARLGSIDERFQSYNIEMVEVTGGQFWRAYNDRAGASMLAYRPPIDLANPRLRKLAAALGPTYLRVSGTSANSTYFDVSGRNASAPPPGFATVLTRAQWKGVIDFARAVDAKIVTSFAVSQGTRDPQGNWTPTEASKRLAYTRALGSNIAAAELMNEPDLPGGVPGGYDPAIYLRDVAVFRSFVMREAPEMLLLGPGLAGDGISVEGSPFAAVIPSFEALSYHYYGASSQRCTGATPSVADRDANILSGAWLSGAERAELFYARLRSRHGLESPIWVTETADASCGGQPWDATFLDSFRYLDQLARLAQLQVQVVMHNTLAASDYGLLDEKDFTPRPDFWMALLWRNLMGTVVLDPDAPHLPRLRLYAHCLRGRKGGVAILSINADRAASHSLELPASATRYTISAPDLTDSNVQLNGNDLKLGSSDELPSLEGEPVKAGVVELPPATMTFLAVADLVNPACL